MPFFSIIIPVYNVAPYLRECLDSVLHQTFLDWEAICVDDGSTDGSGAILAEYATKDSRFRVLHQKNNGVSVARNVAIDVAQGEWIGFLDGDDLLSEKWLARAHSLAQLSGADWVRLGLMFFKEKVKESQISDEDLECQVLEGEALFRFGWDKLLRHGWSCLNFIRSSILQAHEELRYPKIKLQEDNVFFLSILPYLKRGCFQRYPGYFYRIRPGAATQHHLDSDQFADFFAVLRTVTVSVVKHHPSDRMRIVNSVTNTLNYDLNWLYRNWNCPKGFVGYKFWREMVVMYLNGLINLASIARRERIPFLFMLFMGTFIGFTVNRWLLSLYSRYRV